MGYRSETVNNNLNPEWNFVTNFEINKITQNQASIEIYDEDLGKDDTLGKTTIDLQKLLSSQIALNQWFTLDGCKSGEVLISAEVKGNDIRKISNNEQHIIRQTKEKNPKTQPKVYKVGKAKLTVHRGKKLEKRGLFGKVNPFVVLQNKNISLKSQSVKNTTNPEWNFTKEIDVTNEKDNLVTINVFDDGKEDAIGQAVFNLNELILGEISNKWVRLEKCKTGQILLSGHYIPIPVTTQTQENMSLQKETNDRPKSIENMSIPINIESERPKDNEKEIESKPKEANKELVQDPKKPELIENVTTPVSTPKKILEPGKVLITVFKARDIEKKGQFGKADPYVKMTLGQQKAKSATVKNNHNPEWNFKASFDINENTTNEVSIAVFDEDFGKDDTLGSTVLDLTQVQEQKQLLNQWIPLKNCKSGEVLISAEFIPQAAVQKQKESEPLESIAKQDDTQKSSEITIQETHIEQGETETYIKKETQIETSTKKGGKGLKEVLNKEKKVSSEVIVQSGQSMEPEVVNPKPKELEPGLITVTVHKARDIEKKGMFGKADPYVIMTYGDQKAKSKTIKNNYNPEWEFTAKFNIKKEVTEGIKISVFDDDIGKDDALGMKVLDIAAIQEYQQLKSQWIPLESCKSGEVLISAEFTPQAIVGQGEKSIDTKSTEGQKKDSVKPEDEDKDEKTVEKIELKRHLQQR